MVAAVIESLRTFGCVPATAGAFTRRAFDNGKLDLGQVEALGDLIAAETEAQRRAALVRTGGRLAIQVDGWRTILLDIRADLEATLDFAEDDGVAAALTDDARQRLHRLGEDLAIARDDSMRGERLFAGVSIAIIGPVNAGKSSLLNRLAQRDAAMVSPMPGTTRDAIEVRRILAGVPVTLIDTAGSRDTADALEAEGIRRGMSRAADADLIIDFSDVPASARSIRVVGRSDLTGTTGWHDGVLHLSPVTGEGIDLLERQLTAAIETIVRPVEPPLLAHARQTAAVEEARAAVTAVALEPDPVLVAEGLRRAAQALDRLIGRGYREDVLDQIFARFCIGK